MLWLPSVSRGSSFPPRECAPVLAPVKQTSLDGGCGPALIEGAGNGPENGSAHWPDRRRVVGGGGGQWIFRKGGAGGGAGPPRARNPPPGGSPAPFRWLCGLRS